MTLSDRSPSARRGLAVFAVALALMTAACTGGAVLTTASPASTSPADRTTAAVASVSSTAPSSQPSARAESDADPDLDRSSGSDAGSPGQCDSSGPALPVHGWDLSDVRSLGVPARPDDVHPRWLEQHGAGRRRVQPHQSRFSRWHGLFFWRDVIPVEPDGTHVMTVPSTVAGITDWLRADPQLVVSDPMKSGHRQGSGHHDVHGRRGQGAVNKDPECAAPPRRPASPS